MITINTKFTIIHDISTDRQTRQRHHRYDNSYSIELEHIIHSHTHQPPSTFAIFLSFYCLILTTLPIVSLNMTIRLDSSPQVNYNNIERVRCYDYDQC